jgi:hypothetical protein
MDANNVARMPASRPTSAQPSAVSGWNPVAAARPCGGASAMFIARDRRSMGMILREGSCPKET